MKLLMYHKLKRRIDNAERGDTIVEVLITTAIISLILVGAYVTTNSSLLSVRSSQEHSEALSIDESQIEGLRANQKLNSSGGCFVNGTFSTSNCSFGRSNQTCTVGSQVSYCYHVAISLASTSTNTSSTGNITFNTYKAEVTWPSLNSTQTNDVQLFYRMDTVTAGNSQANANVGENPCSGSSCTIQTTCTPPPGYSLINTCYN